MAKPNIKGIKRIVFSSEDIVITDYLIKKVLCFEDMREFFAAIHEWGYSKDFTYQELLTESFQLFIREFLKENYLEQ